MARVIYQFNTVTYWLKGDEVKCTLVQGKTWLHLQRGKLKKQYRKMGFLPAFFPGKEQKTVLPSVDPS